MDAAWQLLYREALQEIEKLKLDNKKLTVERDALKATNSGKRRLAVFAGGIACGILGCVVLYACSVV